MAIGCMPPGGVHATFKDEFGMTAWHKRHGMAAPFKPYPFGRLVYCLDVKDGRGHHGRSGTRGSTRRSWSGSLSARAVSGAIATRFVPLEAMLSTRRAPHVSPDARPFPLRQHASRDGTLRTTGRSRIGTAPLRLATGPRARAQAQ